MPELSPRSNPLILIVDDDKNFSEIISTQLASAGYQTASVHTSAEALKKAKELLPDLILMDIFLSPADRGTDVALALKQDPQTQNLKIAFLSSMKDPWPGIVGDKRDVSRDLGMDDFIDKTDDLLKILGRVRQLIVSVQPATPPAPPPITEALGDISHSGESAGSGALKNHAQGNL